MVLKIERPPKGGRREREAYHGVGESRNSRNPHSASEEV